MRDNKIQAVIDEYRKSGINSEAEVRSKFVVPLIEALGYPSELRAEEFPVYGYAGREKLHSKPADFLLFTDKDFANHTKRTQMNLKWVEDHSLLVVEAKKPGELSEDTGQARFYNAWSKAVAYIMTDGEELKGFYFNPIAANPEIISCKVSVLAESEQIWKFSYEEILNLKSESLFSPLESKDEDVVIITSDEDLNLPEETIAFARASLGKNAVGLSNVELIARFLNTTDSLLRNNLRYNIPEYIINFPRRFYAGKLYIDNYPYSIIEGEVLEFYWEDIDKYIFYNDCIDIYVVKSEGEIVAAGLHIHVLDYSVYDRIKNFETIYSIIQASNIYIHFDENRLIRIPVETTDYSWKTNKRISTLCDVWVDSLEKLKNIEDYYEIEFKLEAIEGEIELSNFYNALEFVFNGMMHQQNSYITLPKAKVDKSRVKIEEPVFLEEINEEERQYFTIHGVKFESYRSYLVPEKAKKKGKCIYIPVSCECRLCEE